MGSSDWCYGQFTTNVAQSTGTSMAISALSDKHQVTVEYVDEATSALVVASSSPTLTLAYRPVGTTYYIDMVDTFDLSSKAQTKIFEGRFNALKFTPGTTWDSTCAFRVKYSGWKL